MSVNKVILIGNVGKDPEVHYFEENNAVARFTLATTERAFTTKNGVEVPARTEWHNISCFRGLAKIVESYVKKGNPLYVEGRLRTRSYEDSNGVKKYVTEIYADNIELLGRKSDNMPTENSNQNDKFAQNIPSVNQKPYKTPFPEMDADDDDLPF